MRKNADLCGNLPFFHVFLTKEARSADIRQREALPLKPVGLRAKPAGLSSEARRAECVPVRFMPKTVDMKY